MEYEQDLERFQEYLGKLGHENNDLKQALASSQAMQKETTNLIELQLENLELINKIEHILRGDMIKQDEEGNEYYIQPKKFIQVNGKRVEVIDEELILLNDYGVANIMGILRTYVDKLTTLSQYTEERMYEILADLGEALNDFIYSNYERMGLNSEFKRTRYPSLVIQILHAIESAYRKALFGDQSTKVNESRIVTQSDHLGNNSFMSGKKKFNPLRPSTW